MLKNVLSLLLSKFYSKKESELVGHQATPSDSYVDFTLSKTETSSLGSTEEILNAIAPCDGYLFVRGRSLTDSHRLLLSTRAGMYINAYGKTITTQGTVVVFKGENISVSAVSMTDLKVRLYKFVGSVSGGVSAFKNALLQGGVLCRLKHLYSSLRRSSCRVREKKLGVGLIQKAGIATLFTSMVSLQQHRSNIPHLRMELCNLLLEQIRKISSKSRDLYTILRPVLTWNTQKNGLLHIIELQRDAPSNLLYSHSQQQALTTSSLFPSTKPAVGGASC